MGLFYIDRECSWNTGNSYLEIVIIHSNASQLVGCSFKPDVYLLWWNVNELVYWVCHAICIYIYEIHILLWSCGIFFGNVRQCNKSGCETFEKLRRHWKCLYHFDIHGLISAWRYYQDNMNRVKDYQQDWYISYFSIYPLETNGSIDWTFSLLYSYLCALI